MRFVGAICVAVVALYGALAPLRAAEPCKQPAPTRLTVVVILASSTHKEVNPKLATLATEVQKVHEDLTGFKLESVLQKSLAPGESHTFELIDKQVLKVTIDKPKDKNGRVGLTVTPPGLDEVSYACTCDKFFPLVTPHKTKAGDQLILAILAKPCTGQGP
jgi:hypothetical protein